MRQTQLNLESIHELGVAALSVIFLSTSAPSAYFKAEGKLENSYGWSKIPHHIGLSWIISDKLKLMNNQVSPPSNNQSENELLLQPPKNQSKIVLVLTTLLIVAVGVAIALGYQLFTQNQKIGLQPSTPTTPPAPTTLSPTASAPDSRTYTDPKNRFSFSYPQSWQVNDKSSSNQDPQLTFTNISEGHTINISVWRVTGFGYCYIYGEKQTIVVGTKNAETADGVGPSEMCDKPEEYANRGNTYVLIPLEDTTDGLPLNQLHISYDYPLSDKSIAKTYLNEILSSVKLTTNLTANNQPTTSILEVAKNVQQYDDKGNTIPGVASVDIIIDLDPSVSVIQNERKIKGIGVSEQTVKTVNSEYLFTSAPGGLCPWKDDGSGCTYSDEKISKFGEDAKVRVWRDNQRGVFALNFQSLEIGKYYVDHFEIYKRSPNESFTNSEITTWKNWVMNIKTIPHI
jgi:hypothetical protein